MEINSVTISVSTNKHDSWGSYYKFVNSLQKEVDDIGLTGGKNFDFFVLPPTSQKVTARSVISAFKRNICLLLNDAKFFDDGDKLAEWWLNDQYSKRLIELCNTPCSKFKV